MRLDFRTATHPCRVVASYHRTASSPSPVTAVVALSSDSRFRSARAEASPPWPKRFPLRMKATPTLDGTPGDSSVLVHRHWVPSHLVAPWVSTGASRSVTYPLTSWSRTPLSSTRAHGGASA